MEPDRTKLRSLEFTFVKRGETPAADTPYNKSTDSSAHPKIYAALFRQRPTRSFEDPGGSMRKRWLSIVASLIIVVSGTSCVPPSCFDLYYGFSSGNDKAFVTLRVFSEPIKGSFGSFIPNRFANGASMNIPASGRMTVSGLDLWPTHCPTIPREDLTEVSRAWEPILRRLTRSETSIQMMPNKYRVGDDDWHPDGPLLSLSLMSGGKHVNLLWDGSTPLSPDIDLAVMTTLEVVCSNSRPATRSLNRNLPPQVTTRLACTKKKELHR